MRDIGSFELTLTCGDTEASRSVIPHTGSEAHFTK